MLHNHWRVARLLAIFAAATVLTGARQPAAPPTGAAFEPATPESQGLSTEALKELSAAVQGYLDRDLIVGGELVVIKNRRLVLHEVFGHSDRESDTSWQKNTICNMRSMTKALTGAAAQILIDRGLLALHDPVAKYLTGFDTDVARDITIDQIMSHRAGLPLSLLETTEDMTKYSTLVEMANAVGERGPEFPPGSKFWYSDAGTEALGGVVETITGETLDAFWQRELIAPLHIDTMFSVAPKEDPRLARVAPLYVGGPNRWSRFWTPESWPFYPYAWGSQSLYGTPLEYAKFLAMWMDEGESPDGTPILSREAIARTLEPLSPMSVLGGDARYPTDFKGLELWYGRMAMVYMPSNAPHSSKAVIIGHGGSDGTMAWAWPERDLMVLYYTQSRGGTTVLRLEKEIDRLLIHPGDDPVVEAVPERFEPYVGVYIANFAAFRDEEFTVLIKDGKLALDIPSQLTFELLEADEEGRMKFAMAPDQISISFDRDEQGEVHLLQLHQAGMTFDVPRKGTELARKMSEQILVDPESVAAFLGTYHDPESNADLEVYLEDRLLCIKAPPGIIFHLVPTDDPRRFSVKQLPIAELSFETDAGGAVVSMTRHLEGEQLIMPRKTKP